MTDLSRILASMSPVEREAYTAMGGVLPRGEPVYRKERGMIASTPKETAQTVVVELSMCGLLRPGSESRVTVTNIIRDAIEAAEARGYERGRKEAGK